MYLLTKPKYKSQYSYTFKLCLCQDQMAQIPIMDKDFFLILVTGVCNLEFDFQSPLAPSGPRGQKTYTRLRVLKFGIGLAKNTPANQRFNIQMQIKGSQISFIPNNI